MTPRLVGLCLSDPASAWRAIGFDVDDAGGFVVGGLVLQCVDEPPAPGANGIVGWTLADGPEGPVDGLATASVPRIGAAPSQVHDNGASRLDHLVLGSPHRERTIESFRRDLGLEPRRQTEHELYGRTMVQTFYLLPPTLLEVISRPEGQGDGPLTFWGLAFVVDDLDATVAQLGPGLCSPPKDAVQPGRRIASVRGSEVGLTTPVAFLTPRP